MSIKSVLVRRIVAAASPDIDAGEQEQPDHVDEVPVPSGGLEAEMLLRREVALHRPDQTHGEKDGADDHMETVEAGRHEKRRTVNVVGEAEAGMRVFIGLERREQNAEHDSAGETEHETPAIVVEQRMVR